MKMRNISQTHIVFLSSVLLLFITSSSASSSSTTSSKNSNDTNLDFIKTSCNLTLYKSLCYGSLSPYVSKIHSNPKKLAVIALNLTLSSAKSTNEFVKNVSHRCDLTPLETAAVADCVEEIEDSVNELQNSIKALSSINLNSSTFEMVMSDVETWVSAALTDDDTCMDGFGQVKATVVKDLVRQHVVKVAHMTSNALALVNMYASTHEN